MILMNHQGMMFIEMRSYVGDVLSYYIDSQFKEQLFFVPTDQQTLYEMHNHLDINQNSLVHHSVVLIFFR